MKISLSLAMIVRDEENNLGRCLESVKDLVDEIVIVDTGSKDTTKEIAKRYTDKVYDFEWIDNFSEARNYSFRQCTGTHILWLDADDIIKPEEFAKIKVLDLSDKDMVISNYVYLFDEYGNEISVVPRERIIRRSLNLQWVGAVHEVIPVNFNLAYYSDFKVHHINKEKDRSNRNIRILKKSVVSGNCPPRDIYYLAKEFFDIGKYKAAKDHYKKYLSMGSDWWEDEYDAYLNLAKCDLEVGEVNNFFPNIWKAIEIESRKAEAYYQIGKYYVSKNNYRAAIHWFTICANMDEPMGLLNPYKPEYYTWLPCLQLCVCYNQIGEIQKAYEYNEKFLSYLPNDHRGLNNREVLGRAIFKKKDGQLKKLNLGCGGKRLEGYVNVDLFQGDGIDEVFEMTNIPYADGTISAINSEHSLEHLPFDGVEKALKEWSRVLIEGGELILKIPDLEICCRKYLDHPIESNNFFKTKFWFKSTIYGIQKSQAGEPDEAQIHKSGFSKGEIKIVLERNGFIVDYMENYDGWHTPSVGIRAVKKRSGVKVGWVGEKNWDAAQTRIRVLNVNRWLRGQGYQSDILDYTAIMNRNYDVAIVGKGFDENHFKNIRMLKQNGKTVICDLCEDILQFNWVKEILEIVDIVVCCSAELERRVKPINPNTKVIEDAYET